MPNAALQLSPEEARAESFREAQRRRDEEARRRRTAEMDAVVAEIRQLRKDADDLVLSLVTKSEQLRKLARTNPDEGASHYLVFANAHLRVAGALGQGFRRTASMDRVLATAEEERQQAQQREAEREAHRQADERARQNSRELERHLTIPQEDAFDELYGDILEGDDA